MAEHSQLVFAYKFPYASAAKGVIKDTGLRIDDLPEEVINRAALLIANSWKKKHSSYQELNSRELMEYEVLAFPVAKILLSFLNDSLLNERFAQSVADSTFHHLSREKQKGTVALDLARDFSLHFTLSERQGYFACIGVNDFLKARLSLPQLKLVNQSLEGGKIFLSENDFCRFVAQFASAHVLSSLPVETKGLPDFYRQLAFQLKAQLKSREFKEMEIKMGGKMDIDSFPPCMKHMYSELFSGVNLPHMARFDLATFLVKIGLPEEEIDSLFSHAPNYDKKTTLYHVRRIARLKLSAPACKKVREHGYCPLQNCTNRHPVSFYGEKMGEKSMQAKQAGQLKTENAGVKKQGDADG